MNTEDYLPETSESEETKITKTKGFREAEINLKRLQAKIAPFSKKRKLEDTPPKEQWVDTHTLIKD
jgi:hypothetical protein